MQSEVVSPEHKSDTKWTLYIHVFTCITVLKEGVMYLRASCGGGGGHCGEAGGRVGRGGNAVN